MDIINALIFDEGLEMALTMAILFPQTFTSHAAAVKRSHIHSSIRLAANSNSSFSTCKQQDSCQLKELKNAACGILVGLALTTSSPVIAANQRLPPLSTDPNRCERAFVGNTIGQANGVYDKAIDLRFCDYTNDKTNLKGKSLAAALMSDAKFDGADMSEVVMSKAYAVGASFKGTDFTNAVLDRVNFGKANLQGASFKNTVLSGSTFDDAQLQDVVFEDTIIGRVYVKISLKETRKKVDLDQQRKERVEEGGLNCNPCNQQKESKASSILFGGQNKESRLIHRRKKKERMCSEPKKERKSVP
ncbi:hypothetical protein E3N88_38926 [Mikania micrantha]|uniref:Thylakoid lumenal 17.4 kDa protein, chloroplastic n=1 Tax=Mikania micrantha TaxID=192012 RepID=A0A5N6LVC3_9ASTR|nr:hypothetical protein E3N88_38926 [Mikania micrantha]